MLAELAAESPGPALDPIAVLTETLEAWPNHLGLEIQRAEILWQRNEPDQFLEYLRPRAVALRQMSDRSLAARAFLLLAEAEARTNAPERALAAARQARKLEPAASRPAELIEELSRPKAKRRTQPSVKTRARKRSH